MADFVELTNDGRMLIARTLFCNGTELLGLLSGDDEVADTGYHRQPFMCSQPQRRSLTSTAIYVENVDNISFGPWDEDASDPVTGWFISQVSGGGTIIIARGKMKEARERLHQGDEIIIRAGVLLLTIP